MTVKMKRKNPTTSQRMNLFKNYYRVHWDQILITSRDLHFIPASKNTNNTVHQMVADDLFANSKNVITFIATFAIRY